MTLEKDQEEERRIQDVQDPNKRLKEEMQREKSPRAQVPLQAALPALHRQAVQAKSQEKR